MSSKLNRKTIVKRSLVGAAGVALVAALAGGAPSGADFSATDNGSADVETAMLTMELSAPGQSDGFDLSYDNLAPGEVQSQTFYVRNTGSIPATVSLKQNVVGHTAGPNWDFANAGHNWQALQSRVDGYTGWKRTSNEGLVGDLGTLEPGELGAYVLEFTLEDWAGNEWQGMQVSTNVVLTLNQL